MLIRFSRKFRDDLSIIYSIEFEREENSNDCCFRIRKCQEDPLDPTLRVCVHDIDIPGLLLPDVDKAARDYINVFPKNVLNRKPFDSYFNISDPHILNVVSIIGISAALGHYFTPYTFKPRRDSRYVSSSINDNLIGRALVDWAELDRRILFISVNYSLKHRQAIESLYDDALLGRMEYGINEDELKAVYWCDTAGFDLSYTSNSCTGVVYRDLCEFFNINPL